MIVRSSITGYVWSLAAVAAMVGARLLLDPLLGDELPFITLYLAVAFATRYGGRGPGLLAVAAGAAASAYFLLAPRGTFSVRPPEHQVGLVVFAFVSLALIALVESLRNATRRADEHSTLLQTTLASIGDAVITTDTESRITSMNPVAESLTGWTAAEATGRPLEAVFRIVDETTREPVGSPVTRSLHEGVIVALANPTVLIAKDGTERPIDDSAAPIRDQEGAVLGCVLVFRDVSERRRTERELRDFFDNATVGLHWVGPQGTILRVNQAELELLGYRREEYIGRNIAEFHADADVIDDILRRLGGGEALHDRPARLRCKDGSIRDVLISSSALFENGKFVHTRCFTRDVTERKAAEERTRRNTEEIETLLDTLPIGVFITRDFGGREITGNRAAHELLRTSKKNLSLTAPAEKRPTHFRVYKHGVEVPAGDQPVQRAARGEPVRNEELDDVFDDGTVVHTVVSAAPLYDENGRVRGAVATVLDVTDRKQAEERLKEADRRKDEFLATLAHELRNPLAPIKNSLELMKRAGGDPELIEQARAMVERQIGQMVRLVDDLLDVSRITLNKLELRIEPVELASIVHHAVEACRPDYERAGHHLTVTLPPDPIYLDADATRLAQVFGNLLTNAGKYTEPGGRIALTAERHEGDVQVTIKDSGVGIPADMLPKVFDLFTQVDRTLERAGGGLGIGLSLVQRLVAMHRGTVTARSEGPGRGSEFIVRLPALAEPPNTLPGSEGAGVPAASKARRILIVDDNRDSADSLAILLRFAGHDTETAYDGVEGIEKAGSFRPDALLLDIGMPKLNGYDACRLIRERPWGKAIVLVALTGWGQAEDRRRSDEAGFDGHMVKPVDPIALVALLDSVPQPVPSVD